MRCSLRYRIDLSKQPHLEVNSSNRLLRYALVTGYFLVVYFVTNHLPIFKAQTLPISAVDEWLPFLPWTTWIYITDYAYPVVVGFLLRDSLVMTRLTLSFFLMANSVGFIFIFFPTYSLRENYALNSGDWLIAIIRILDSPLNCFPSAHVAILGLSLAALQRERPKLLLPFLLWAALIVVSTLTTKQHYFIDVIGGGILGYLCFVAAEKIVVRSQPNVQVA